MDNAIIYDDVLLPEMPEYKRIKRLRRRLIEAPKYLCIERARIITNFYKNYGNAPAMELRTEAFKNIMENMSVFILDEELIVGHQASKQRSVPIFPEFAVEWIKDEIDLFETREQDPFITPLEVKREFLEEIYPFWKGRTISDMYQKYMTERIKLQRYDAGIMSLGLHEEGGFGHVQPDFKFLIDNGLKEIVRICKEKLAELTIWKGEDIKKKQFYTGCITVCEGMDILAKRYAKLARDMAKKENDEQRKGELLQIAEVCSRVPYEPARNLHEALQSAWFYQLCMQIYDNGVAHSPGRLDVIFKRHYDADIASGTLSKPKAQELLTLFLMKFAEPLKIYRAADVAIHAGFPMGQNVCVGGIDAHGREVTSDLSYRWLEAHRLLGLGQPNFSVRLHMNSPYELLRKTVETIRMGSGMPQIINDHVFIPALMELGVPLKKAREYGIIGCVEGGTVDCWGRTNGGYFNIAKYIELALNDGVDTISGKQVGPKTGDPRKWTSYEQFWDAFKQQMEYGLEILIALNNICDIVHEEMNPVPIVSMLVGGCLESGRDVTSGGARYNWTGPLGVGIADTGNSLYAVKKAVFEDKKFTISELMDAIEHDFVGYEVIQKYLFEVIEKYGNDHNEVDQITNDAMNAFFDALEKYENYRGGKFCASLLPVASYVSFGKTTGALPYGRKSGEPLADGISPNAGTDKCGPTAVLKSVTRIDHMRCPNGVIFNQKFTPSVMDTPEGVSKFVDYIRSYIQMGGAHMQINVVSSDTLKKAQKNPDEYKGLVVRVAGYSAFFSELSKEVQDTIIARTELGF